MGQAGQGEVGGADHGDALFIQPLLAVEDVGLGVQASLGIDLDLQPLFLDQADQGPHQRLGAIGLVHQFDRPPQVAGGGLRALLLLRLLEEALPLLGGLDQFQPLVALADLLDRFPAAGVADQQAQFLDAGQIGLDRLQPGEEEVAHGEPRRIRRAKDPVDVVDQLLVAVVDDVVGHLVYRLNHSSFG